MILLAIVAIDFIRKVQAGEKDLLPRKGTNDLKVPRYPEVSGPQSFKITTAER